MKANLILIVNKHPKKTTSLPFLKRTAAQALDRLGLTGCTVEITLVTDAVMRRLNTRFMHEKGTTDVLSFPQVAVPIRNAGKPKFFNGQLLGDIVISLDQAERQAKTQGLSTNKEIAFLVLHSLLHLIGYDHDTQKRREQMQGMESKIWLGLEI